MKMKLCKRIAIMASGAIGVIGTILMLLEIFNVKCFSVLNKLAYANGSVRVVGLIFALIVVCAIAYVHINAFLIAFKGEKAYKARLVTLKGDKNDVVLIQQDTLDALVRNIVGEPAGVADLKVDTSYRDMMLNVNMELSVDIDTDIRDTTDRIQKDVRNQLENVNGIRMSGVSILISKINVPEISDGMSMPWASKTEDAVEEEKSEEVKTEASEEVKAEEEPMEAYAEETEETVSDDDLFDPMPLMKDKSEE